MAERDRHRGDCHGSSHFDHSRGPSRFSDDPLNHDEASGGTSNFRSAGTGGHHRSPDSPPRRSPGRGGRFGPRDGPGGFGFDSHPVQPHSGQKRDRFDGRSFVKLFVGSVPRTATKEDIRPLFEKHGNVLEVVLIKDRKSGQQRGFCFIKYATSEEADQAIRELHNQHTLPGGVGPIKVRYAHGERERLGADENKLFVGSSDNQVTVEEAKEIFSEYGQVEEPYLLRNRPLAVRFANPKRPRQGNSGRPSYVNEPMGDRIPPRNVRSRSPMHLPNMGPSSNSGPHGVRPPPLSGPAGPAMPMNPGVPVSGFGGPMGGPFQGQALSSMSQQNLNPAISQLQTVSQQMLLWKPMHSSQDLPPSLPSYPQASMPYLQTPMSFPSVTTINQNMAHLGYSWTEYISPEGFKYYYNSVTQKSQWEKPEELTFSETQQQMPTFHPYQPQLAQMFSQQTQTLQASCHSYQQAFSQAQQVQMMQIPSQGLALQQDAEAAKNQSQWAVTAPQAVTSTHTAAATNDVPSSASAAAAAAAAAINLCWTEHISPEGFKYYYNSITRKSQWEKPEELALSESQKQQQMATFHQYQSQLQPPALSALPVPQLQQVLPQGQVQILHQQ